MTEYGFFSSARETDHKQIPKIISEFSKDAGYEFNTRKLVYATNEQLEIAIRKILPFTITPSN